MKRHWVACVCHAGSAAAYIILRSIVIITAVIRTQISLTDEQMERLKRTARRRRTSIAALIREAVDATVPDDASDRTARQRRAFALAGAYSSGRTDTSERHDEVLAEEPRW